MHFCTFIGAMWTILTLAVTPHFKRDLLTTGHVRRVLVNMFWSYTESDIQKVFLLIPSLSIVLYIVKLPGHSLTEILFFGINKNNPPPKIRERKNNKQTSTMKYIVSFPKEAIFQTLSSGISLWTIACLRINTSLSCSNKDQQDKCFQHFST